jgi:DHA1 family quinolone resistance protein-like MFS transporter
MQTTKQIQRTYTLILSLFWLATGLPMALGILLVQARGLDLFQVGVVMGAYSLTIVLLEVPTGGLADAIGRKRVALLAYSFSLASGLLFLSAFSFPALLVAFILNGVGRALSSGALDAWFVDSLQAVDPDVDLQPALAQAGTFSLLALGMGALLGSALPRIFDSLPPDGTAVLTPLSTPLVLAAAVQVVMLALTLLLVREERPADESGDWRQGVRQVPDLIHTGLTLTRQNPTILRLLTASFASGLVLISLEALWQPRFAHLLGGSQGNSLLFGLVMGGNFVAGMVGNMASAPLARLLGKRYALVCAIFQTLRGCTLVVLALQTGPIPATLLFWLVYGFMGVVNSPHATLMNREIPARQRSSMLSIESLVAYVGSFIGSAGLGYLAEQASIGVAWIVGGAILMVQWGLYLSIDAARPVGATHPADVACSAGMACPASTGQKENHGQDTAVLETGEKTDPGRADGGHDPGLDPVW